MSASGSTLESQVLAHLDMLLQDRRFATAERNTKFLRYVVERTLADRADEIKETVIAAEVYGRAADYDPKTDSIVRVEASRLRQKLRAYYENEGRDASLRIHLPSGTYVPRFEAAEAAPREEAAHVVAAPVRFPHKRLAWVGLGILMTAMLLFPMVRRPRPSIEHPAEAVAAWREGIALLGQDPHAGQTDQGAPPILTRAVERLEFAVARDPKFAPAWATLAEAYDYVFAYVGRDAEEDARRAEAAAQRAVELDDRLAAGHHMLGLVLWMMRWDFAAAEQSYRRALELDPQDVNATVEFADLLRETGRIEEAAALIRKSRALLPGLPQLAAKDAEIQMDLGHAGAAIAAAKAALQLKRNFSRAYVALGTAEEAMGETESALTRYEHVLEANPTDRRALPALGYLLARSGQRERAREVAQRLERMNANVRNCAFQVAVVYAGLGERDRALEWLERARETRQVHFPFASVEPRFRELRKDKRFQQLLARAGLKPA